MAQLNDLIVTGKSRFLNEINGKIDWSNVNNKPSSFTPASHGHGVNTTNVGSASGWSAGSVPTVTAVACDDITS